MAIKEEDRIMFGLTDRQQAFIESYVRLRNATRAAIEAGYSEDSARTTACKLMAKPLIKQKIREMLQNVSLLAEVELVDVLKGLKSIAEEEDASASARVSAWSQIAKIITEKEKNDSKSKLPLAFFNFPTLPRADEREKWDRLRELGVDVDRILNSGVLFEDGVGDNE